MLFTSPSILGLAAFTVIPVVMSLVIGLHQWPAFGERAFVGVDNYAQLLGDPVFRRVVLNTILFVVLYLPLNIVMSMGLAVWISPRIRGRTLFQALFFLPVITPMVANAVVWRLIYQPGGLIDSSAESLLGVGAPNFLGDENWAMAAVVAMSVWQGFGYNMLVFSAALDAVPRSLTEAALIDGAGPWRRFFQVTLPMVSPAMFFATTMTLITSLQVFTQVFLLTAGGPGISTETVVVYVYNEGFSSLRFGLASAAAWVLFVMILGVTALQFAGQRRWVHYDE
ncbi:carbohydrate ABC transporter permease [Streptomyces sp. AS02]|uniref:carbohydrate ABC transporter permease n=1 Tax=Streptomyces sp. AS02 TaxID=2938946 RepID=UPI00202059C1|nr:sugar ABC transporter permease [Streptomyces sp. AS02]MCL8014912.1 sugar ABC transporter permease [Streptomyces sp. AS02]